MTTYTPDVWVVLELDSPKLPKPIHKVFAGWYGGFAGSDRWKLSSEIKEVRVDSEGFYELVGVSTSVYCCHYSNYKMSAFMSGVLSHWLEQYGDSTIKVLNIDEIVKIYDFDLDIFKVE